MVAPDDRLLVISVDCHAGPPSMRDYRPWVEARHVAAFDDYCDAIDAYDAAAAGDLATDSRGGGAPVHHRELEAGLWDPDVRRRYLDGEGLAGEVVYPQGSVPFAPYPALGGIGPKMAFTATAEQRDAGPAVYNRWLADLCAADPGRHAGVAVVPIRDPERSAAEVERAREAGLFGGVSLPPVGDDFPKYHDPCYERLWAACAANDMPLALHGGAGKHYGDGPEALPLVLAETDWHSHRALWFLIFGGALERHPGLTVTITEQRMHWVPSLLHELDSVYRSAASAPMREVLAKLPSEYFAEQVFMGGSFMSRHECGLRHDIGLDRVMWGSDFPHLEGTWPWTSTALRWTFDGVPADELAAILGGNPLRCFDFDPAQLRAVADGVGPRLADLQEPVELPSDPEALQSWAFHTTGPWS